MQLTVAGLATYSLITKLAQDGNIRAIKIITSSAGKFIGRINPYMAVALFLGEAIAFALEIYAEAHDDELVLEWIDHSIWGNDSDISWDMAKEHDALNKLFVSPMITTEFNWLKSIYRQTTPSLLDPAQLLKPSLSTGFVVILPGYQRQVSEYIINKGGKDITEKGILEEENGFGIIRYADVSWFGNILVEYWPDKNKDEIKYTAED